jgi:preprotein translocase subunit SecE
VAERKRPGDDAADERPDDEAFEDSAVDEEPVADDDEEEVEDDEPVGRGGTAVRERRAGTDATRSKKDVHRTGFFGRIGGFFREIVSELRKVIWPTRRELLTYTAVVIGFVTIMTAIVAVLDFGFAKAVLFSFGN